MARGWTLDSDEKCANFNEYVANMRMAGKRPRVQFMDETRSLDQNAQIYALYGQIASQCEDKTVIDIRRDCKLRFGVPLLRASDESFCKIYDTYLKAAPFEAKLVAMDFIDVTSKFNVKQASEFIDQIIHEYSQQGISLLHPSEMQK